MAVVSCAHSFHFLRLHVLFALISLPRHTALEKRSPAAVTFQPSWHCFCFALLHLAVLCLTETKAGGLPKCSSGVVSLFNFECFVLPQNKTTTPQQWAHPWACDACACVSIIKLAYYTHITRVCKVELPSSCIVHRAT